LLEPAAEMRRAMIERGEAARAVLVAKLEQNGLSVQARRNTWGKLQMIELRLRELREQE
jgi:hypothetical protein